VTRITIPTCGEETDMIDETFEPLVDEWYRDARGNVFKVVAIHDADQTIEVQHYDGAVEDLEPESWRDMGVEMTDEPEDWSAPFDDLEEDDIEEADSAMHAGRRGNPLDGMDFEE
jgi:hypothetical protein